MQEKTHYKWDNTSCIKSVNHGRLVYLFACKDLCKIVIGYKILEIDNKIIKIKNWKQAKYNAYKWSYFYKKKNIVIRDII